MKSIAERLPPDIARQLNPARRKNESAYWAIRDQLLAQYEGQWIGFAEGRVVASGVSPVTVFHAAEATGLHPFFICVGREEEPCRIRRATFAYDSGYLGEALPHVEIEFRQTAGAPGVVLEHVIPDTGADASVLPWADCQLLRLDPPMGGARLEPRRRRWLCGEARLSDLGEAGRPRLPLPTPSGLRRRRTHPRARRSQSSRVLFRGPAVEVVVHP